MVLEPSSQPSDGEKRKKQGRKKLHEIARCLSLIQYLCTKLGYHKGAFRYITHDTCSLLKDYGRGDRRFPNGAIICGCHCHLRLDQISVLSCNADGHVAVFTVPDNYRLASSVMETLKKHAKECEKKLVQKSASTLMLWMQGGSSQASSAAASSSSSTETHPPEAKKRKVEVLSMFQNAMDSYYTSHCEAILSDDF
jgi:hypothetical protein